MEKIKKKKKNLRKNIRYEVKRKEGKEEGKLCRDEYKKMIFTLPLCFIISPPIPPLTWKSIDKKRKFVCSNEWNRVRERQVEVKEEEKRVEHLLTGQRMMITYSSLLSSVFLLIHFFPIPLFCFVGENGASRVSGSVYITYV